ncbi:hypothetical protein [Luteolibacter soli]|uniref:Secreted protein n=1 Tax=Luteolibacter soli TaxID=3135280 RepID=A0ABU9B411_9BACT
MSLLASVLSFFCFLAATVVMTPAMGEDGSMGFLTENLPATIFGASGFLVLAGTVFASRTKAPSGDPAPVPTSAKTSNCPAVNPGENAGRA